MYKLFITIVVLFCIISKNFAQECNLTIEGHVIDIDVKEQLSNANIYIKEIDKTVATNSKGDFIFTNLCSGKYTLKVTHINCAPYEKIIDLTKSIHLDINMPHAKNTLGDVVVSAQKERQNSGFKKELSGNALQATNGTSLAQALGKINGVTLLQTGSNVSKPVIHGLSGSRLLIINNGVRLEGQQWGNEHAPEVDPFIADKLIIIKGVDELKYGSDAIGGVILVEPKPLRNTAGKSLEINTGYFTNNKEYYLSGIFEQQLKKKNWLTYRMQATYKKGANASTPNYRLNNTGVEEFNFSGTVRVKKDQWNSELFYSNFYTNIGIFTGSHIGNLTDLLNAISSTKPNDNFIGEETYTIARPRQEVQHQTIKSKTTYTWGTQKINALISAQFNQRQEFDIVRSITNIKPQILLNINTLAEDINWDHSKFYNLSGTIGLSAVQQQNTYSGRYFIPNYISYTSGVYAIEKWAKHLWELQAGLRFDNKSIKTTRLRINNNFTEYKFNFNTYAASLNAIYKPTNLFKTNFNIALSSRAPYVNELLSDGIHHGTATYEKGNINLQPEKSIYLSWNNALHTNNEKLHIEALFYANRINDFIYQQPKPNEPVLTIAGAFPQIQYLQTNALLYGTDFTADYNISKALNYNVKYSILFARNRTIKDWLILMPSNRLAQEFTFKLEDTKNWKENKLNFQWTNVAKQNRIPSSTTVKQDYKDAPNEYNLFQMGISTILNVNQLPIHINIGVENIFNTVYRDYLNGFRYFSDETGRNITLKIKFPILN